MKVQVRVRWNDYVNAREWVKESVRMNELETAREKGKR